MQARLFLRARLDAPVVVPVAGGTAVVFTRPSPQRTDDGNEDAVGIFGLGDHAGVLAVADGVGGHSRGQDASRVALEILGEQLDGVDPDHVDLREPIMSAIERTNVRLVARNPSPATTLVVATIIRGNLRCYTVGDSELMVIGQRGKLKLRTIPHSPTGYARESGLLDEAAALLHDERHVISNVLGIAGMHVASTTGLHLAPRDTVVLGSDGVFDNLFHDEIIALVRAGEPLATAKRLAARLAERMAGRSAAIGTIGTIGTGGTIGTIGTGTSGTGTSGTEVETPSKPDDVAFILFRPQPPSAQTLAKSRAS